MGATGAVAAQDLVFCRIVAGWLGDFDAIGGGG